MHDPPLTEEGLGTQCASLVHYLQNYFPAAQNIDLIVVSPLIRTLQTVEQSLGWLMSRGIKAIMLAELQETTSNAIDIGHPIPKLTHDWPQFDWSVIDPVFPKKAGLYQFSPEALLRRGRAVRKWLRDRPEKVIAVVSHGGFMRIGLCWSKIGNADFRDFEFAEDDPEDHLRLVEWELTESAGGGMGNSPKGVCGWEVHDFKYMPENKEKTQEELEALVRDTPYIELSFEMRNTPIQHYFD